MTEKMDNVEKCECTETISSMKTLMLETIKAEDEYKRKKFLNEQEYNNQLLNTDWDTINEERKEKGLPKLSNQDMKKAYIQNKMFVDYDEELNKELKFNEHKRKFDVAMKYSYDILR